MANCNYDNHEEMEPKNIGEVHMSIQSITFEEVNTALAVIRHFTNRDTFKALKNACMLHIPAKSIAVMKGACRKKLKNKPTVSDFFSAITVVGDFLMIGNHSNDTMRDVNAEVKTECKTDAKAETVVVLNSQGFHSQTVVACMNILLRANDFTCMEAFSDMIDDNDMNEEAQAIKRILNRSRNNMIAPKQD